MITNVDSVSDLKCIEILITGSFDRSGVIKDGKLFINGKERDPNHFWYFGLYKKDPSYPYFNKSYMKIFEIKTKHYHIGKQFVAFSKGKKQKYRKYPIYIRITSKK